jgi:fatty acid desaturase
MMGETASPAVDMNTVREILEGLRQPRLGVYLVDLLLCSGLGWGAFALAWLLPQTLWLRAVAFAAAVLLLYRALAFVHELFHQQAMAGFRALWHALAGVPLLIPLLLYLPIHQGHHNAETYGTSEDGEYEQFHGRTGRVAAKMFAINLALPLALWLRFAVLTPLSLVLPMVRRKVIPGFVHLSLRIPFRAPELRAGARREAYMIEASCALFAWGLVVFAAAAGWSLLIWWSALVIAIATLNTWRALCATHLYVEHAEGRGALGQLADSLNVGGSDWLTPLICPVGLRYHALHHIAPYLPYHAMGEAHRRLLERLPAGSVYHQVSVDTLAEGWRRLAQATQA